MTNITFLSDTHTKQHLIPMADLPGGDILIHCGDITSRGYYEEATGFMRWFNRLDQYTHKVFIAGNHDFVFEKHLHLVPSILALGPKVTYLQDSAVELEGIKIYGSPWQPEFYNWAFNLPRGGQELRDKWTAIPKDTDILVTHGPPFGKLDVVPGVGQVRVGCEVLSELYATKQLNPAIHAFGHIHCSYGTCGGHGGDTTFINASSLNEGYQYQNRPININYDKSTGEIEFTY
jgi:Icc-related predicted phosphoesterase